MSFEVLDPDPIRRVALAIEDMRAGRMVILMDDEDRENEGDLVIAAEKITPEAINFMATHARGLICLSMTSEQVDRLGLPMMASNNQSAYNTAFTVSVEAREGVTTGISAQDRTQTCLVASDPESTIADIVTPGHIFPLRARDGGVLERVGQTEGSVDLARMAGLRPAGVICEVMNADGSMARFGDLKVFGQTHQIRIVTVADLIKYRMRSERVVQRQSESSLEVEGLGTWQMSLYRGLRTNALHLALSQGALGTSPTLVRVQAAPPPWSFLAPSSARLARQARAALTAVREGGGGAVVFMHLGGGGPDPLLAAFDSDFSGKEREMRRASAEELRDLGAGCQILRDLGLQDLRLLTNSSRSIVGVEAYGLNIVERVAMDGG